MTSKELEIPNDEELILSLERLYSIALAHRKEWEMPKRPGVVGASTLLSPDFKHSVIFAYHRSRLRVYPKGENGPPGIDIEPRIGNSSSSKIPLYSIIIPSDPGDYPLDIQQGANYPDNPDYSVFNPSPDRFIKEGDVRRLVVSGIINVAIEEFANS